MPSRPSIRCLVAASFSSLPFMNLAAKPSMFLPRVTSGTLEARAASSFSTAGGRGNGEFCGRAGNASTAAPTKPATSRNIRVFIGISPLLVSGPVVRVQLRIHFVERVAGDAQRDHHLAARFFSLAPFLLATQFPLHGAAQRRGHQQSRGHPLPNPP